MHIDFFQAISLKCYIGDGTASVDCSSLVANTKYCAKITLDFQGLAAYSCVAEPQTELGIDVSSITQSLSCYERKIDPLKGEYCFCSTDNCNDRYASTTNSLISANGLKVIFPYPYLSINSSINFYLYNQKSFSFFKTCSAT